MLPIIGFSGGGFVGIEVGLGISVFVYAVGLKEQYRRQGGVQLVGGISPIWS